jgi:excisionase family DNA binding protein|tara:strand:- start:6196 stop:6519 length:324 start_codon:yes stop_codon:yes gene_type:complete
MTEKYLPIEDLANHLSVKVSTIRQWVKQGHIPISSYLKVGQTYRFDIPSVVDALKVNDPPDTDVGEIKVTDDGDVEITIVGDSEGVFDDTDNWEKDSFEWQDDKGDS